MSAMRPMTHGFGACKRCGKNPAEGFASIGDDWYCHPDDESEPDCYTLTLHEMSNADSTLDIDKLL